MKCATVCRFKRRIYDDPIAKVAIQKLNKDQVRKWRLRLEEAPARVTRSKAGAQTYLLLADCRRRLDLPHFPPPG